MWILLAVVSSVLLGLYDISKKESLVGNNVLTVLFLNTLFCALLTAAVVLAFRMFGPSYFVSAAFAGVISAIVYLAVWRLRRRGGGGLIDCWLLLCVGLQLLLYVVSCFMEDYTRFNLYFAVDIALTFSFAALLPLALREVAGK